MFPALWEKGAQALNQRYSMLGLSTVRKTGDHQHQPVVRLGAVGGSGTGQGRIGLRSGVERLLLSPEPLPVLVGLAQASLTLCHSNMVPPRILLAVIWCSKDPAVASLGSLEPWARTIWAACLSIFLEICMKPKGNFLTNTSVVRSSPREWKELSAAQGIRKGCYPKHSLSMHTD